MRGPGHEDGTIPDAEVAQRRLDAVVYREYLDAAYTLPKTTKLVQADRTEPAWYARVPGTVIWTRPGQRLRIHVLNCDDSPHSFHVHGLAYGIDSDGAWPFGVTANDGARSDQICPGESFTYTFDVTREMIGCWPFHSHHRHVEMETNLGLFGGVVVRDPRERAPDHEIPFFMHRMQGDRLGAAFDSGTINVGGSFSQAFPLAGTFEYYCRFHPMAGTVVVDPAGPATVAVQILDGPGRFSPDTVTVAPGGTVEWTNNGSQPHTVTEQNGAGSLESMCVNGRAFVTNTPLIQVASGRRMRWYVFNTDFGQIWHNFHPHAMRWEFAHAATDTRSIGPAESFVADTIAPDVLLPPCREREDRPKNLKKYRLCADFPVHCHAEHHMMNGMVALVRARQTVELTPAEYRRLGFELSSHCREGHELHCPDVDAARCGTGEGEWTTLSDSPIFVVHAAVLRTGRVLLFSGTAEVGYPLVSHTWDPASDTFSPAIPYGEDLFCSGHTFLEDGRLLVAGGAPAYTLPSTHIFDPGTESWTKLLGHDMNVAGRWYPTLVPLDDGRVFMASGIPGAQPMEIWDPATQNWTLVTGADKDFSQLYPSLHLAPNGRIFYSRAGWNPQSGTDAARLDFSGANSGAWTNIAPLQFPDRQEGSAVIFVDASVTPPVTRVLIVGGGVSGVNNPQTAEIIDVSTFTPSPAWVRTADMNHKRTNVNAVLLPDGTVLVVGGQRNGKWAASPDPVLETEIYDPDTDTWTQTAPLAFPKQYHSIAVLLPDGRVLAAGGIDPTLGGAPARDQRHMEVFEPPYLSAGSPPAIGSAPATASFGSSIVINTPDAASIQSVALLRPGAVTHHTDAGQRYVKLAITGTTASSVTVDAPADGLIAPPGFWMLFLVNTAGVPSVAHWIQLS
jgi:plastocyanin